MTVILLPKTHVPVETYPLFFLAGPIKGATRWHDTAIDILMSIDPNITVASPAFNLRKDLVQYQQYGEQAFPRARAWERHYMNLAGQAPQGRGSIMFWLPEEDTHYCDKAFGAITRFEFGKWTTRKVYEPDVNVVIGTNGRFPQWSVLKDDLDDELPDIPIYETLEDTCKASYIQATSNI